MMIELMIQIYVSIMLFSFGSAVALIPDEKIDDPWFVKPILILVSFCIAVVFPITFILIPLVKRYLSK